jgi:hypothetical protein
MEKESLRQVFDYWCLQRVRVLINAYNIENIQFLG